MELTHIILEKVMKKICFWKSIPLNGFLPEVEIQISYTTSNEVKCAILQGLLLLNV